MVRTAVIDEYPILQVPDQIHWSENYAMLLGDPVSRTSVYYSCGRWLDDLTIWREVIAVVLPANKVLVAKNYGRNSSAKGPGASLSSVEVLEPERKLRYRFAGPMVENTEELLFEQGFRDGPKKLCEVDLIFDGVAPVWNMRGDSVEASTIAGSLHIEQIGSANGSIVYDGQTHRVADAYCVRDHSRGVRDVSQYRWHCWINGRFPGDRFFYVYGMQVQGSKIIGMSEAAIFQDGRLHPAKLLRTDLTEDPEDHRKLNSLVLGSDLGEMEVRFTEVVTTYPNSMIFPYDMSPGWTRYRRAALMLDQFVTLEWDGRKGIGWSERGIAREPL